VSYNTAARCRLIQALIDEMIDELEDRPLVPLKDVKPSRAAGAYLLYTIDIHGEYAVWALAALPLYSGKCSDMADRLTRHTESITQATNLDINHFMVKFIELPEEFSHLSCMFEAAMLRRYEPFWNGSLTGFGAKEVGGNRIDSKISDWDAKHPGRKNRGQSPNEKSPEELSETVAKAARGLATKHLLYVAPVVETDPQLSLGWAESRDSGAQNESATKFGDERAGGSETDRSTMNEQQRKDEVVA
jgi:hypothetical protein